MKEWMKKTAMVSVTGLCAMLLFGLNGKAYLDPSVSSYLIQAIAGVVIAVVAVVSVYVRKAKKKLNKKLGIDDNRNKEVESNDI